MATPAIGPRMGEECPGRPSPAGSPSSSLDPQETTLQMPAGTHLSAEDDAVFAPHAAPPTPTESAFRHSGWAARRLLVWQALRRTRQPVNRLRAFANCGGGLWLAADAVDNSLCLVANHCHDRFCVPCGTARAREVCDRLGGLLHGLTTRFVTLTLRANHLPLSKQLDRLYACYTALRRRKAWAAHVRGAVACCEVKIGAGSDAWHVHLHVITEGLFWPQRELSAEWYAVTGDSSIVHVKLITDRAAAAHYVTKYVTKPADSTLFSRPDRLDECLVALKSRRLLLPSGSFRVLLRDRTLQEASRRRMIASIPQLAADARAGEAEALHWWRLALAKFPRLAHFYALPAAAPPDG